MAATASAQSTLRKGILVLHRCGLPIKPKTPVYMLLSGFPDPPTTYDEFAKPFEDKYHVVKMCYPDMDQASLGKPWGYTRTEVMLALKEVVEHYREEHECPEIYLHGFDWGATATLQLVAEHPNLVTKLVQQDIGMLAGNKDRRNTAVLLSYNVFLAGIFAASRLFCGNEKLAKTVLTPIARYGYPWFLVFESAPEGFWESFSPHICYPYYNTMKEVFFGNPKKIRLESAVAVPHFFAYGAKKHIEFHGKYYLEKLDKTPGCQWKKYDAGHWLHHDLKEDFQKDVQAFFDAPESKKNC